MDWKTEVAGERKVDRSHRIEKGGRLEKHGGIVKVTLFKIPMFGKTPSTLFSPPRPGKLLQQDEDSPSHGGGGYFPDLECAKEEEEEDPKENKWQETKKIKEKYAHKCFFCISLSPRKGREKMDLSLFLSSASSFGFITQRDNNARGNGENPDDVLIADGRKEGLCWDGSE